MERSTANWVIIALPMHKLMNSKGTLHQYFINNPTKRLHKWLHYFDIYEKHFDRFVNKSPTILEIGVHGGGSLEMWKNYFGDRAKIIGIDINPECKIHESEGIEIFIGSQDDTALLNSIKEKYNKFDIVIDDGSHKMSHMKKTFLELYSSVQERGLYLVEDTHTCYSNKYEGGLRKPDSFIELAKELVDHLNASYTKGEIPISTFTTGTSSISFYDSIIVFEKSPQGARQPLITKGMAEK